jgi:hypothetical protein
MQPDFNPDAHNAGAEANNDREGAMAKADLYKLANYSLKLFKRMDDSTQLESWVQAKITKAADYIASVYHYLEYEMKFSEYGEHLANAEVMSEDRKREILTKLTEAKAKVAELKKAQAEKIKKDKKEKKVDEAKSCNHTAEGTECPVHGMKECGSMEEAFDEKSKVGDTYKTQHGTATKTSTGLVHKRDAKPEDDEDYVPPKKEKKTAMTGAERREQKAKDKEQEKASKAYEKKHPGSVKRYVDGKQVNESDKGDMDHDGKDEPDSKEYMDNKDKAIKKAMGKEKKVDEAAKPDFLDMDKDGNKKEPMKKAVADKKKNPFAKKDKKVKEDASTQWKSKAKSLKESLEELAPSKEEVAEELEDLNLENLNPEDFQIEESQECDACHKDPCECEEEKTDSLNESTELDRMKQFLTRLNG